MKYLLAVLFIFGFIKVQAEPDTSAPETESQTQSEDVFTNLFWHKLYAQGGWSLYCGLRFDHKGDTASDGKILIEHIYPTSWVFQHLDCNSRLQCRNSENNRFREIESDLHNLYPVWWELKNSSKESRFGQIDGEDWRFNDCDYERRANITEPRPIARGNIARAIFYMYREYGLPIDESMFTILKEWNRNDPPSAQETQRNDKIERIQGKRNLFIDNPALVETIDLKWLEKKQANRTD